MDNQLRWIKRIFNFRVDEISYTRSTLVRIAEVYSQIAKDNVEESIRARKYGNIAIADIRHVLRVYPRVSSSFRDIRSSHIRCIVSHPADACAASRQMSAVNRDLMIRFLNPIFVLERHRMEGEIIFYIWMCTKRSPTFSICHLLFVTNSSVFSFLPFSFLSLLNLKQS